jgi:hypothetical protein
VFHYNHIHLDLANHGSTNTGPRRICKPTPDPQPTPATPDSLPPAPDIDEPVDIAHLSAPDPAAASRNALRGPGEGLDPALPPAPVGEANPAPPALPSGPAPSIDMEPTSTLPDHDN